MAGKTIAVTDQTFAQQVLQADIPVLVDFGAPWCPPCRAIEPALEELANAYADDVIIAKVNSDKNPRVASEYGITALPTIVVFQDGRVRDRLEGARTKAFYTSYIQDLIRRSEAQHR